MNVDEIIRHAQKTFDRGRRRLQKEYDGLIANAANLSHDEAERLGELAEKLGRTEAELRSDLTRDRRRRFHLFIDPDFAGRRLAGVADAVYLTRIIDGVSCGPEFDRTRCEFVRGPDQSAEEFARLLALADKIGPRGARGSATRAGVEKLIAAGTPADVAVHLSRSDAHVELALLQASADAANRPGVDAVSVAGRLLGLPNRPIGIPGRWLNADDGRDWLKRIGCNVFTPPTPARV